MSNHKRSRKYRTDETVASYLFLIPNLLLIGLFLLFPIGYALVISFSDWNGYGEMSFIGWKNYRNLVKDAEYVQSLWTTLRYTLIYVTLLLVLSLLLALLVNAIKGIWQNIYRTIFIIPFAISLVVASLVWTFLTDIQNGYFNQILAWFGVEGQYFLASESQALYVILAMTIWLGLGYNLMVLLAAIKDVPKDYYEAANIDGAGKFKQFIHITLPSITGAILFVIVISTIGALQVFDQFYVMTGGSGGPNKATNVTVLYIFNTAFITGKVGYASSMAFVLFLIISLVTILQFKLFSKNTEN